MAVEKRKYANRTTYRAYWRNPFTGKVEKGPARDSLKDARRDDAEIKLKLEYEPEYFLPDGAPLPGSSPTLEYLSQLYLARSDLAESTRRNDYHHFSKIVPTLGHIPATSITRDDLKSFELEQRNAGIKQNTIQRKISIIRAILNWAVDQGLIQENPIQGYRCKRGEDLKLPPPSPAEIRIMLEVAPPHLQRVIIIGYYLGVRVGASELLALKWSDIDMERKRIRVWSAKKNRARPWRDIDIVAPLFTIMCSWIEEDKERGLAHLVTFDGKPVKKINHAWATMMKTLADPEREKKNLLRITRRIRPYDLRHAFATEAIAGGADIKAVADIMGHQNTEMIHRHYQHVVDEQKKKVVQSIPDVLTGVQERGTKQSLSGYFSYPVNVIFQ